MKQTREQLKDLTYAEKIEYYSTQSDMISLGNGNSKTGKACLTLSFPAGVTCRADAPCRKICYAMKGKMTFPNVCGAYHRNYRIWNEDPAKFEKQFDALLTFNSLPLVRIFDTGDLPSKEFLEMLLRVTEKHPEIKFLMFTKRYEWVNEILNRMGLPSNFCIRFSMWDKNWNVPNPHNLPVAYVDFANSELNPEFPQNCFLCYGGKDGVTCSSCRACFNSKVQNVKFVQH